MGTEPGLTYQNGAMAQAESSRPYYPPVGNEETVFKAAYRQGLSLVLKGPTGCGKTRFVEAMAHDLGRPLITVACHDDLTTADLVGRYLLKGDETVWVDGPLTRAVREGAICYLDEVVEARQDTTVVLHPLADYRRQLPIERLGITLDAAPGFGLVVSYNPGYQSVLKDLKDSTRQRMVAIEFGFPIARGRGGHRRSRSGSRIARRPPAREIRSGDSPAGDRGTSRSRVDARADRGRPAHRRRPDHSRRRQGRDRGTAHRRRSVGRGLNEMIEVYLGRARTLIDAPWGSPLGSEQILGRPPGRSDVLRKHR